MTKTCLADAAGTVYIRADGSIDPPTANVSSLDNVTYTLTGDINGSIVVEKDSTVIDGAGYTLENSGNEIGILLSGRDSVEIKSVNIQGFVYGVYINRSSNSLVLKANFTGSSSVAILVYFSSNNTLSQNRVMNESSYGIEIYESSHNTISQNTIANTYDGIALYRSSDNLLQENNITNNWDGVFFNEASQNTIYHNNLIDNVYNARNMDFGPTNIWDYGYSLGGNYWGDYTGTDANGDGIGDITYIIDANNHDQYPLISSCTERIPALLSFSTNTTSKYLGLKVDISGILTDTYGSPLRDRTVVLGYAFPGGMTSIPITSCSTSILGHFSAQWIPQATGYFAIKAEWAGNVTHIGASSTLALSILPYENQYVFTVESNSTISELTFDSNSHKLGFVADGENGTIGYTRVTIAKSLAPDITKLRVNLDKKEYRYTVTNMTDSWVLFLAYNHSIHQIEIDLGQTPIPEFPSFLVLPLFMVATLLAIVIYKRRHLTRA